MPTPARRVLARYLWAVASDRDLWPNAAAALTRYEKLYQGVMHLTDPLDEQGREQLQLFSLSNTDAWPRFEENPFGKWMRQCYDGPLSGFAASGPHSVLGGREPLVSYQQSLKKEHDAVAEIVSQIGPERFAYKGFKIYNLQRMTDSICLPMLEAIDYLVALFKKRGVDLGLLREGLRAVYLLPNATDMSGRQSAAGTYLWGVIELSASALRSQGSMLSRFMNEVFLHEFGHHVHTVLPPEAVRAWEEPWTAHDDAVSNVKVKFKQLSRQEREQFFKVLERTNFDVSKAGAKLKGLDKLKFGAWLRNSYWDKPLIKPRRFQLTEDGKYIFDFFKGFYRDPDEYTRRDYHGLTLTPEQLEENKQRLLEMHKRHLSLDTHSKGVIDISEKQVQALADADPEMNQALQEAEAGLARLKTTLVTDYAKTSVHEDFAETFVAFMDAPQRLSDESRFRMQRTLSLAGLYGKPVMRLARSGTPRAIRVVRLGGE